MKPPEETEQQEPIEESYMDVRRACHAWLMERDPAYRRNFQRAQERNHSNQKRKNDSRHHNR